MRAPIGITLLFWLPSICAGQQTRFAGMVTAVQTAKQQLETAQSASPPDQAAIADAQFRLTRALTLDPLVLAEYLADPGTEAVRSFLSEAEQQRFDKQIGGGAGGSGTTSLISKGSVPQLLGLAVEDGAATEETSGTTLTFRANPTGIVKALVKHDYLLSGPTELLPGGEIKESDLWYRILNKASASVSFDTSQGSGAGTFTGNRSQLTAYSGHYDILNHRDPRDKANQPLWSQLRTGAGVALAGSVQAFSDALAKMDGYEDWVKETSRQIVAAASADVPAIYTQRAEALRALVNQHPEIGAIITRQVIPSANAYADSRRDLLKQVKKSLTLAFDYTNTRQIVTLGGTSSEMLALPPGITNGLPDLGNFLFTASGHFIGPSEITANLSGTRFNGRPAGPGVGRWRDVQFGVQIDTPLPRITGVGKPTLTFSGLILDLLEQPLGAEVLVNGVAESRVGTLGFAQAKMDFPLGSSGLHLPISITYASRTELILEKDVRGNIGITYDLDKLFAKSQ
jgi:hypothetical protein